MFTPILRLLFLLLFLIFPGGANTVLHAEETPDMDDCSLYIESKTDVASAQCMIDGGNQEDDKKRTDVGIGEEVELTVTGKRLKEVDLDSIEWTMEPDNLATVEKSEDGDNQAILTINKDITENKILTIRVKTNLDEELPERKPLILHIFIPSEIMAVHTGKRMPKCAADGEKDHAGASTVLDLTLHPLKVSFSNIAFIERANDPEGFKPEHDPGAVLFRPNAKNKAIPSDYIGWKFKPGIRLPQLQASNLPKPFSWACGWHVRSDDKDCLLIHGKPYPQDFNFTYDGEETDENSPTKGLQNVKVTVSKFRRTVTRSTTGKVLHTNS